MKVTALIPDEIINDVQEYTGGKNITDSLVKALSDWLYVKRIQKLIKKSGKNLCSSRMDFQPKVSGTLIENKGMILIDTSVWVEFFKANPPFTEEIEELLENKQVLSFEPVFAELLFGSRNDRERSQIISYWQILPRIAFDHVFYSILPVMQAKTIFLTWESA
jgi:hypothetical protein